MKKQWNNPQLKDLELDGTKEPQPRNYPHFWECNGCGMHYESTCEPTYACERCGSTAGYTFRLIKGDSAVTLPNFNGKPVAGAPIS